MLPRRGEQYPVRDPHRGPECRYALSPIGLTFEFRQDSNSCDRSPRCAAIPNMIGRSEQMQTLREKVNAAARVSGAVLITGESGSGKELVARAIHELSDRSRAKFVPVDCGALPDDLIESELFGHKRGAFTTAVGDKPGFFEEP